MQRIRLTVLAALSLVALFVSSAVSPSHALPFQGTPDLVGTAVAATLQALTSQQPTPTLTLAEASLLLEGQTEICEAENAELVLAGEAFGDETNIPDVVYFMRALYAKPGTQASFALLDNQNVPVHLAIWVENNGRVSLQEVAVEDGFLFHTFLKLPSDTRYVVWVDRRLGARVQLQVRCEGYDPVLAEQTAGSLAQVCPGNLPPRLIIGQQGRVTPGDPNNLRAEAKLNSVRIGRLLAETVFQVEQGPVCADGYTWWYVRNGTMVGWTVEADNVTYFVEPIEAVTSRDDVEKTYSIIVRARPDARPRVRSGPGTQYSEVTILKSNQAVEAIGISADGQWFQIVLDGQKLWVSTWPNLVSFEGDISKLPVAR
ncbi:MAG: hypothetical protein OHK0023_12450 [Anaerolineae bacterium]